MRKDEYPDNWKDEIRPAILKRDNFKCKDCGAKHRTKGYYDSQGRWIECDEFMSDWAKKKGFKVFKMSLQIAHLDQNPHNNTFANLQTKCPKCHLNYDRPFNKLKRLSGYRTRQKAGILPATCRFPTHNGNNELLP